MEAVAINEVEVPSRRFGRYRVRARLGAGGMCEVFLADAVDARGQLLQVALKLPRRGVPHAALGAEAALSALLHHPNLVHTHEAGEAFGRPFLALEYLVGGDLRGVLRALREQGRGLPVALAVHVVLEVLRGLAHLHRVAGPDGRPLRLVHGDVSPGNVFFSEHGAVKLGDFSLTHGVGTAPAPGRAHRPGTAAGTLHYLSPEQARGERASVRSDLFSVGALLHELLVGVPPFAPASATPAEVLAAIRGGLRPPVPPTVDRALAAVLERALAPEPAQRFASAGELAGALTAWTLDTGSERRPEDVAVWLEGLLGLVV